MTSVDHEQAGYVRGADSSRKIEAAIVQLAHAYSYAQDADCSPWEFAVEIESLLSIGLTTNELRWLVTKGYVKHAREVTRAEDRLRRFRPWRSLCFPNRACFVLTDAGVSLVRDGSPHGMLSATVLLDEQLTLLLHSADDRLLPSWDRERRELRVGCDVVKRFRLPSPNQEMILSAFEEEKWPAAIDDPLPYRPGRDPKCRLRSTIQSLNSNQQSRLLYFRGDGTGMRVLWELVGQDSGSMRAKPPMTSAEPSRVLHRRYRQEETPL